LNTIAEGGTVRKDPSAQRVYGMTWDANLPAGVQLTSSSWSVFAADGRADDGALTTNTSTFNAALRTTQIVITGGTAGRKYRVSNHIVTNETPVQVDERSFFVEVEER
jgi:hypothetical protein